MTVAARGIASIGIAIAIGIAAVHTTHGGAGRLLRTVSGHKGTDMPALHAHDHWHVTVQSDSWPLQSQALVPSSSAGVAIAAASNSVKILKT